MNTYKITNITNLAKKRDFKFNTELNIEYVDNIMKKTIKIKPGKTVFLSVPSLPISVHRLRVKNLITVVEISAVELAKILNNAKPKPIKMVVEENEEKKLATKIAYNKKRAGKKEELVDIETNV